MCAFIVFVLSFQPLRRWKGPDSQGRQYRIDRYCGLRPLHGIYLSLSIAATSLHWEGGHENDVDILRYLELEVVRRARVRPGHLFELDPLLTRLAGKVLRTYSALEGSRWGRARIAASGPGFADALALLPATGREATV
jgi:hypothetical protein